VAISKPAKPAQPASAETKPVEPSEKQPCFVISPIGPDESDVRKKADQVLRHIIKKALGDTYAVERADDISKPGLITLQIIERLMKAPMVVADLSDANANVYYELAIRHFVKKPVVHLITEGQKPPFDVAQMRYISYDLTDPDSVERAAQEVRDHTAACERGEVTFTPIQFVELLDTARDEGEDQFVSLALGIQSALSNLQADVRQVGAEVSYLASITEVDHPGFLLPSARGGGFARIGSQAGLGASAWPPGGITGGTPLRSFLGRPGPLGGGDGVGNRSTRGPRSPQNASAAPKETESGESEPVQPTPAPSPKTAK
jgi:hypothetical protein